MPFTSATLSTSLLPTPRVIWTLVALWVLGWLGLLGLAQDSLPVLPILRLSSVQAWAWRPDDAGIQNAMTTLSLPQVTVAPGVQVTIPLTLSLTQGQVYGVDCCHLWSSCNHTGAGGKGGIEGVCDEIISQGGDVAEIDRWYASGWDGHICGLPFNDFAIERGKGYFAK